MVGNGKRHRLTLHVEGRGACSARAATDAVSARATERAAPALPSDFEKLATCQLRGDVSRQLLVQHVCDSLCSEALLHEDSLEVAALVGATMRHGGVEDAALGARLPMPGRDTTANLDLHVSHTIEHGPVKLAFGTLSVAVPGAHIVTSVSALRVHCLLGEHSYSLSAHLTPMGPRAHSECHQQRGGECVAVRKLPRMAPGARAQPGTLSHRNHRLDCQETHSQNVLVGARMPVAEQEFCTHELLSRKVARISTRSKSDGRTVHTVFFR